MERKRKAHEGRREQEQEEGAAGMIAEAEEAGRRSGRSEEPESELRLIYNSACSYDISALTELWKHQVAEKLHSSPSPHNVAVKALEISI